MVVVVDDDAGAGGGCHHHQWLAEVDVNNAWPLLMLGWHGVDGGHALLPLLTLRVRVNIVDVDDALSKIISDAWQVLTCHAIDLSAMSLTLIVHTIVWSLDLEEFWNFEVL